MLGSTVHVFEDEILEWMLHWGHPVVTSEGIALFWHDETVRVISNNHDERWSMTNVARHLCLKLFTIEYLNRKRKTYGR